MELSKETVNDTIQIIDELIDFVNGIENLTDTEREEWIGEPAGDGLEGRAEAMRAQLYTLTKRGKQNSTQARK